MRVERNVYKVLMGKPEGKRPLELLGGVWIILKCIVGALPLVSGVHKLLMERLPDHLCN